MKSIRERDVSAAVVGSFIFAPEHQVAVFARASDQACLRRDGDSVHLVAVSAQDSSLALAFCVPYPDRLICGRREQTAAIRAEHQLANPTGVSFESRKELTRSRVPDADSGIFESIP